MRLRLEAEPAYVAAGFLGELVYGEIKLRDFAAGKILLEEAGGFRKPNRVSGGCGRPSEQLFNGYLKSASDVAGGGNARLRDKLKTSCRFPKNTDRNRMKVFAKTGNALSIIHHYASSKTILGGFLELS
jgi:hypothetical protein